MMSVLLTYTVCPSIRKEIFGSFCWTVTFKEHSINPNNIITTIISFFRLCFQIKWLAVIKKNIIFSEKCLCPPSTQDLRVVWPRLSFRTPTTTSYRILLITSMEELEVLPYENKISWMVVFSDEGVLGRVFICK